MDALATHGRPTGNGVGGITDREDIRVISRAMRREWGISDAERAEVIDYCLSVIRSEDARITPYLRLSAVRSLVMADGKNVQRERNGIEARQGDAMIALTAVRTQLAAQLAADPNALAALSGGAVIPAVQTLSAASRPPVSGGRAPSTPPPVGCSRCEDAGVIVTSQGAVDCPDCAATLSPTELAAELAY